MFTFKRNYFFITVLLFLIEVFIAAFVRDAIIRPYAGDFLVVMLLYSFLRSFTEASVLRAIFMVLLFSYSIEILQIFNLAGLPGFGRKKIVLVVLGSHFEWMDMLMYTLSALFIIGLEKVRLHRWPVFSKTVQE